MDQAGGAVAVWPQRNDGQDVQAANMTPDGSWEAPVDLAPSFYEQRAPQVAMNEAGVAVAVWEQVGEQTKVEAAVRTSSGQWGSPETLSPEGSVYTNMDVAVGPAGEAVAVWSEEPRYSATTGYRIEGSFMPPGGNWESPVTISATGYDSWSPQVVITPTGHIVATWYGFYNHNSQRTVQAAESRGSTWSSPQDLSGARSAWLPKIAANDAGATVIWEAEEGWIESTSRVADDNWEEPVELSGPESIEPRIDADAAGNVFAIWSSGYGEGPEHIEGSALPLGGAWSEPAELSGPLPVESTEPRLDVAPDGEMLAAWSTWRDGVRLVEADSGSEGNWSGPTTLSTDGKWAVRAAVALNGRGNGTVAWWAPGPSLPQATEFVSPPTPTSPGISATSSNGPPFSSPMKHGRGPRATVDHRVVFVRGRKAYFRLRCHGSVRCEGDLRLIGHTAESGRTTSVSARAVSFSIRAGSQKTIVTRLDRMGQRLLSTSGANGIGVRLVGDGVKERNLSLKPARASHGNEDSFCPPSQAHDFTVPLRRLPRILSVPSSGRLPFGPKSYRLFGNSGVVTSDDPVGFVLRSEKKLRQSPAWNLRLELQEVSASGKDIGAIRSRQVNLSKKNDPSTAPVTVRLRPGAGPDLFRTTLTIRDRQGRTVKFYEEYLRKMKPAGTAMLAGILHEVSGERAIAFRVVNSSNLGLTMGRGAAIEEFTEGQWSPIPGPERFVGPVAIDTAAGVSGPCESLSLPADLAAGSYRLRKNVSLGGREKRLTFPFTISG